MFGNLASSAYWQDIEGRYLWCNSKQAAVIELSKAKHILNKSIFDLCATDTATKISIANQRIMTTGIQEILIEQALMLTGVSIKTLSIKTPIFSPDHELLGLLGISIAIEDDLDPTEYLLRNLNQAGLSKQQSLCVMYLVRGYSANAIAGKLNISKRTVESYLDIIKNKLTCVTKVDLIELVLDKYYI